MATALCVVDMLNPYDFEDADRLTRNVEGVIEPIARLVARARDEDAEIIYVNDNYGDWNSSPLLPPDGASFVIKARHTIFYMTPLVYPLSQTARSMRTCDTSGCRFRPTPWRTSTRTSPRRR